MDHNTSVGQGSAHAFLTGCQQKAAHAARLSNTPSRHRGRDVLHRIVDTQAGRHAAA